MNNMDIEFKYAKYHYFINYLLMSDIQIEDYDKYYNDYTFYDVLEIILESDKKLKLLSKQMHKKIGKLLNYVEQKYNANDLKLDKIKQLLNELKEEDNYRIYEQELLLKYDKVDSNLKNKAIIWNKKDIENSVRLDYVILTSLNYKEVNDKFNNEFVFNNDYLLFVKKIIKLYPNVVSNPKYKNKIISILYYNKNVDSKYKDDSIIKGYFIKNYNTDEIDIKKYNEFIELNNYLYEEIIKLKNKKDTMFTLNLIDKLYYQTKLENMIILGKEERIDYSSKEILDNLYTLLDYYLNCNLLTQTMKKNISDILYNFKSNIKKLDLDKYNDYIVKINSSELLGRTYKIQYSIKKIGIIQTIKLLYKSPEIIDDIIDTHELDHTFIKSLLSDNYEEEYLKYFIYNDDYYGTINRFINEYPQMFNNKEISERVKNTLEQIIQYYKEDELNNKENKKTLKRIKKIKG